MHTARKQCDCRTTNIVNLYTTVPFRRQYHTPIAISAVVDFSFEHCHDGGWFAEATPCRRQTAEIGVISSAPTMTVTLHALALETFIPRLQTLDGLLERGAAQIDPAALVDARLAPDMYPLAKQVQIVCYQAIDAVTVLRGEDPPTLETPAETLEQLRRRIAATIDALREVPADALAGAEDRKIERPIGEAYVLVVDGLQYLRDWSLPNFYFHLVTAYDILRHLGVPIGKPDYMRSIVPLLRAR